MAVVCSPPGPESSAALPKPLRDPVCRPQAILRQSPEEEATRGSRRQREEEAEEEKKEEGGSKQMCPTTHFGRKQSSVGSVSVQETSCGKTDEGEEGEEGRKEGRKEEG
ncbi:unnamed protein product [Pleuronectes platessa]|uniref:Uncharacterized protein n=1 Tax=Pleuronectes platessa TaxID=8262 RepID=A0A9N7TY86_PLEPL|nr:unnamed protein product [Pleuronectes platessa]